MPGSASLAEAFPDVERAFRVMWADHGDEVSRQYAGTGAMKSAFTRTGKRDVWGLLDDGAKSLTRWAGHWGRAAGARMGRWGTILCPPPGRPRSSSPRPPAPAVLPYHLPPPRYYLNNFEDGVKQDALELATGSYRVSPGERACIAAAAPHRAHVALGPRPPARPTLPHPIPQASTALLRRAARLCCRCCWCAHSCTLLHATPPHWAPPPRACWETPPRSRSRCASIIASLPARCAAAAGVEGSRRLRAPPCAPSPARPPPTHPPRPHTHATGAGAAGRGCGGGVGHVQVWAGAG